MRLVNVALHTLQSTCFVTGLSIICMLTGLCIILCRESEQNFEETHDRLKRGDMVGVTGKPGREWSS